ncbi:MAG: metal ABC transporter ATP-binding protein [Hyphomicrobiales bacterium]|nr:metal ABC transporter ATP-binding protein [Hyphomicrobiales bacterium]
MPQSNSILVQMDDAGVRRDGKWLIRHVDISVQRGEIITIVGPNGSGKSTTLKVLTGILKPNEGKVTGAKGLKIGYVPQNLILDGTMPLSVRRMMNLTGHIKTDAIDATMERFHIDHLADAQVQSLSGGEFQRLLLARAVLSKPQLLILDEPSQGVDFSGQMEIYDYIREYRDQTGASIVLVSHDLHLVMAATDRVICINGHVCCSGTPEGVANNPQYLDMFGPQAAQALAIYRHTHDHVHLPDGNVQHADGTITDNCHRDDGHHHN